MLYLKYFSSNHIIITDGKSERHLYAKDNECFDQDIIEDILKVTEDFKDKGENYEY